MTKQDTKMSDTRQASTYFPATIEPETLGYYLGRETYAIRYADGRVIHRGYKSSEAAEVMLSRLMKNFTGSGAGVRRSEGAW